jgi:hypothetical protein
MFELLIGLSKNNQFITIARSEDSYYRIGQIVVTTYIKFHEMLINGKFNNACNLSHILIDDFNKVLKHSYINEYMSMISEIVCTNSKLIYTRVSIFAGVLYSQNGQ